MRGRHRSFALADVMREAQLLEAQGAVEINLVAQDLAHYGRDIRDGNAEAGASAHRSRRDRQDRRQRRFDDARSNTSGTCRSRVETMRSSCPVTDQDLPSYEQFFDGKSEVGSYVGLPVDEAVPMLFRQSASLAAFPTSR